MMSLSLSLSVYITEELDARTGRTVVRVSDPRFGVASEELYSPSDDDRIIAILRCTRVVVGRAWSVASYPNDWLLGQSRQEVGG